MDRGRREDYDGIAGKVDDFYFRQWFTEMQQKQN